ncbi:hypothetical protein MKEN_00176900 [Mycena kentingensis (nom. inval.)]|nr:hypothetical protein MKEN_00176900 [Mycena kentingensis (nom. inval.)]
MGRLATHSKGRSLLRVIDSDSEVEEPPRKTTKSNNQQIPWKAKQKPFIARDDSEIEYEVDSDDSDSDIPPVPTSSRKQALAGGSRSSAAAGASSNLRSLIAVFDDDDVSLDEDGYQYDPTKARPIRADYTQTERALCRVLYHNFGWQQNHIAAAVKMSRKCVAQAIRNLDQRLIDGKICTIPGRDDLTRDNEFLVRAELAKLVAHGSPVRMVREEEEEEDLQSEGKTPEKEDDEADQNTETAAYKEATPMSDDDLIERSSAPKQVPQPEQVNGMEADYPFNHAHQFEEHEDVDGRQDIPEDAEMPSRDQEILSTETVFEINAENNEPIVDPKNQIKQFLSQIACGTDFSVYAPVLVARGLDTLTKIHGLNSWEDSDVEEALELWFGAGLTGSPVMTDFERFALHQAIRKVQCPSL